MERVLEWSLEPSNKTFFNMNKYLISRLREFMDNEARSCSMDFGCVTPTYVYRMWGRDVSIEEIEYALTYLKANNYGN